MRGPQASVAGVLSLLALALGGCYSSTPTAVPIKPLSVKSPALEGTALPARYTCDGKNISPPIEWGTVPSGVRELALLEIEYTPNVAKNSLAVSVAWGMAGIRPGLHKIAAGEVPPGAHVGSGEAGKAPYSLCPPKGTERRYQFTLYAPPLSVLIPARFVDDRLFQLIATGNPEFGAIAAGGFLASYKRK